MSWENVFLSCMLLFVSPAFAQGAQPSPVAVAGDHAPLYAVLDKARRGEPIRTVGLGGSIISGAGASGPANSLLYKTTAWFTDRYDLPSHTVNSGLGGTNSVYGALRLQQDAIARNPDLVIIDFAVNDNLQGADDHALESIVRNLRKREIAVIVLMMTSAEGEGGQDNQVKIARHYGVPAISYRDPTVWRVAQGRATWAQLAPDGVHPSDLGHEWAAEYLRDFLDAVKAEHDSFRALTGIRSRNDPARNLPEPMYDNRMENIVFHAGPTLESGVSSRRHFRLEPRLAAGILVADRGWEEVRVIANIGSSGCLWFMQWTLNTPEKWGKLGVYRDPAGSIAADPISLGTLLGVFDSNDTSLPSGAIMLRPHEICGLSSGRHEFQFVDLPYTTPVNNSRLWIVGIGWSSAP
jgi:lysophospholipase L1-like esterase